MEKVITLLWILFGVGVFVFRLIMKARETSVQESQERPRRPGNVAPELPNATFEEMLRQMQSRNAGEAGPETTSIPGSIPESAVPEPTVSRTPGGRRLPREIARPARSLERTVVRQPSLEAPTTNRPHNLPPVPPRRSADLPRASEEAPLVRARQPTDVPVSSALNSTVREMLRQPGSVRAAFVLSEIFQRKY